MSKKKISDIRLYKSDAENEFGTISFGNKELNAIVKRIVMKLRENQFSFGEFDHLYINFTTCDVSQGIILSEKVDRYHPWYRYCDVHIEKNRYDTLGTPETYKDIIHSICAILITCFATEDFDKPQILSCVHQAVEEGGNMLMKFKEKISSKRKAVVFCAILIHADIILSYEYMIRRKICCLNRTCLKRSCWTTSGKFKSVQRK